MISITQLSNVDRLKRIQKLQRQLNELLQTCKHDTFIEHHCYVEGGYLNKGYTKYYEQCTCCSKIQNIKQVSDGMYG